tara:strand:- start:67 stop:849 length:783 start_codon:yes stop_codon:yes gene_type:complete
MNKFISNNFTRKLRNLFLFKPTPYYFPQDNFHNVSDFFFWINENSFNTKFQLINLSSNISPNEPIKEEVKLWIYSKDGKKIDEKFLSIEPFELKEIKFDKYDGFGSFFAFHNFFNSDLKQKKSYAVDRGYVGYKFGNGVWSFVHGNHNACALNNKNLKIQPLIAKSIKTNLYCPQVSFEDCNNFGIIFNNPLFTKTNFDVHLYKKNKLVTSYSHSVKPFGTKFIKFNEKYISKINLSSKIIFCRPIIFKEYSTYFDIFHG